jgi:hypothetical protein
MTNLAIANPDQPSDTSHENPWHCISPTDGTFHGPMFDFFSQQSAVSAAPAWDLWGYFNLLA